MHYTEITCPMCDGEPVGIGTLGFLAHLSCRQCGWYWAVDVRELDDYQPEDELRQGVLL